MLNEIVKPKELDLFSSKTIICSHYPKALLVVVELRLDKDGILKNNTRFEVVEEGKVIYTNTYVQLALNEYNNIQIEEN